MPENTHPHPTSDALRLTIISLEPFEARDAKGRTYLEFKGNLIRNDLVSPSDPRHPAGARLRRTVYTFAHPLPQLIKALEIGQECTLTPGVTP